jgi:hypothetical protein
MLVRCSELGQLSPRLAGFCPTLNALARDASYPGPQFVARLQSAARPQFVAGPLDDGYLGRHQDDLTFESRWAP